MDNKVNLWHYTTLEGLKGILIDQTLWATHYRYLNDSSEVTYSRLILEREAVAKITSDIESKYGVSQSFSEMVDFHGGMKRFSIKVIDETMDAIYKSLLEPPSLKYVPHILSFCKADEKDVLLQRNGLLSQWRGYGRDGGFAVIFNMEKLCEEFKREEKEFWYGASDSGDVVYDPDKLKKYIDDISNLAFSYYRTSVHKEPLQDPSDYVEPLVTCTTFLKHNGFQEENEFRFYASPYYEEARNNKYFEDDKSKSFKEIKIRSRAGILTPYIELFEKSGKLPIERVCVGPHKDKKLRQQSIRSCLNSIGRGEIEVICSEIPFIG